MSSSTPLHSMHCTDGDAAACTNSDFISLIASAYPSYFLPSMPSLLDPDVAGEEHSRHHHRHRQPPTAYRLPPPKYRTTQGQGTSLLALSHADPLTVGCCSLHARVALHQQPDGLRTRGLRGRAWGVGFDLLQVPPNPIPCHRYHE
jgi:hypothetical protein